ncbi:probable E3 ubiquitin-protein ligase RNF217 [Asterias rubens]|uniref:probable E3 ubiquitin-protein ligase RNF217 n=1 Tax=Asterias rubens TaxID=7604 RepID=UPI001455C21E|nr:probable E3 ubiquitin-protein ligase RNF217 [Asterias rubens]XP_033640974.1 probable E3 ubiquitin-protein ligase RNF217 [Asterias rubens]
MDSAESQDKVVETASNPKQEGTVALIQEIIQDSLAKLNSLPSTSDRPRNQLRRSLSYPPTFTHICKECTGLCVCPSFRYFTDEDDNKTNSRRGKLQTKRCQSCVQDCSSMSLASLDSLGDIMINADEPNPTARPEKVLFPQGEEEYAECQVCLVSKMLHHRACCSMPICDLCVQTYVREKVNRRVVIIRCLNPACHCFIFKEEILHHLSSELYDKFLRFLAEDNGDPSQKTCPQCNRIAHFDIDVMIRTHKTRQNEQKVACACGLLWCFRCHAPWHPNMSCKEYFKGDRLLKSWAKERHFGEPNAKKCPKCKVYIQRSVGCDNMTCSRCFTSFCYSCGGRFYSLRYFGKHSSRFSVFGCKYQFKPNEPVKRIMIRGTLFGCQLLVAPICLTVTVSFLGVLLLAAGPWYLTSRARRVYIRKKHHRKFRKEARIYQQYLDEKKELYSGRKTSLTPRSATPVDLPASPWQPHTECIDDIRHDNIPVV